MNSKHKINWSFFAVAVFFLCFIVLVAYFFYGIQPSYEDEKTEATFTIKKGERFRNIAAHLSQEGLVRSIGVFKAYALITGSAQRIQPGVYTLSSSMSVPEIMRLLSIGEGNEVTITVQEGSTIRDIDTLLYANGVLERAGSLVQYDIGDLYRTYPFLSEDVRELEGYLFPDTYRFYRFTEPDRIVARFLDTFEEKAWPVLEGRDSIERDLILASYLEWEVPEFDDRRVVAGILMKRFSIGMPLQIDATIVYIICNGTFVTCENTRTRRADYFRASPYNTYQKTGWTPSPISNPGVAAIKAAIDPETTPYLYYLSASDTRATIFSKTLEEHNENRVKYL